MKGGNEMSRRTVWRVQRIFRVIAILGFLLIYGTAGASDCGQIDIPQIVAQSCVGLVMMVGGAWLGGLLS